MLHSILCEFWILYYGFVLPKEGFSTDDPTFVDIFSHVSGTFQSSIKRFIPVREVIGRGIYGKKIKTEKECLEGGGGCGGG